MISIDRRTLVAGVCAALPAAFATANASPASQSEGDRAVRPPVKRVAAGVLDVTYLDSGTPDGRPVVLLHGFPYDVRCYDEVARRLADAGHRVIVPYLRGYGPTRFLDAAAPRVGQQAALAVDLVTLLDALHIERATLAGFDWGGRTACVVAALHPERVSGIVVSGGPGYNIQNEAEFLKPRSAEWERLHWFYYYLDSQRGRKAFSDDPVTYCRYLWHDFSPTWRFSEATFAQTAVSFRNPDYVAVSLHSYRYRIGSVPGDPKLEQIERFLATRPKIMVPAIVLQGADEGVDLPEASEAIAPHFSALRRATVLEGVGHNAPQEAPSLFAEAVLDLDA